MELSPQDKLSEIISLIILYILMKILSLMLFEISCAFFTVVTCKTVASERNFVLASPSRQGIAFHTINKLLQIFSSRNPISFMFIFNE